MNSVPAFNIGNTAFMLLCASLVMLMTPGLAFFYGGLVQRKNVLTIMMQSFMSLGWTTVLVVRLRLFGVVRTDLARHHRKPDHLRISSRRHAQDDVHRATTREFRSSSTSPIR